MSLKATLRSLHGHFRCLCRLMIPGVCCAATLIAEAAAEPSRGQVSAVELAQLTQTLSDRQRHEIVEQAIHILGGNANIVALWTDPVRVASIGEVDPSLHAYVDSTVSDIAALTGLPARRITLPFNAVSAYLQAVEETPDHHLSACEAATKAATEGATDSLAASHQSDQQNSPAKTSAAATTRAATAAESVALSSCANLVVVFADHAAIGRLARQIPLRALYQRAVSQADDIACFFSPYVAADQRIRQGFVYVSTALSETMQQTCIQEEIYQSFGLFSDATRSAWFSFDNRVQPKSITLLDRLLMQTLYEERFGPGAPAFAVARRFDALLQPR